MLSIPAHVTLYKGTVNIIGIIKISENTDTRQYLLNLIRKGF